MENSVEIRMSAFQHILFILRPWNIDNMVTGNM